MSCLVLLWPIDIQACPRSCNCYQTSEVHCTFRSLLTIPPGLPLHTQRINFGFNSITTIHNRSLAGLKKLELLMLHSNNLHYLPDAVFADLKSLQILKLSYNKLLEIPSSLTFSGLTSLLRLYLDHNLLQHIHPRALLQLPSLRLLRLQGNRLHQLHPHALCTLSLLNTYYFSTLRHLDLSNNSLTTLPRNSLGYEKLWRILAYYSETAVRLEREIMLSKAPSLAYRYRQTAETDGYYHSGVLIISKFFTQVPVLRSRPKIAEPHVRTVSFPAESTARLVCESEGEPKPFITWTKVATGAMMSIHSKAQRFEVLSNGTLVIHAVQLQDRGTYICSAHSFLGRDRSITTLDVWTRPPRMLVPSYRETTIHQGGELHLECRAEGVPTPLHSWVLPDRSVLTSAASSNSRITLDTNATLHISAILSRDRGLYRCVASNSAGAASATVHVYVSSLPPVMLLPREEHLLLSPGMPVYAHCSARGAPPPTLRWQIPNGTHVRPSQFLHDNLFVLPNGTLHIRKVGPKDSGNYECTASNAVGPIREL
eukprot:XP_011609252.1 PREDICTED: matrix-remodeling-associated protein 5-like [Takifugu rubripes]